MKRCLRNISLRTSQRVQPATVDDEPRPALFELSFAEPRSSLHALRRPHVRAVLNHDRRFSLALAAPAANLAVPRPKGER